jgi:hypothetical protein
LINFLEKTNCLQAQTLQREIDAMYGQVFQGVVLSDEALQAAGISQLPDVSSFTEASFSELGRTNSDLSQALFAAKESQDPRGWLAFQSQSLISIDNIGISIWGWFLGAIVVVLVKIKRQKTCVRAEQELSNRL